MLWKWLAKQRDRLLDLLNRNDKRLSVFLICFALATFFWFLNALSKTYITTLAYPLVYEGIPEEYVLVNAPENQISLEVESYGFNLLGAKFQSSSNEIVLKLENFQFRNKKNGKIGFLTNKLLFEKITDYLNSEVKVNRVLSDSLFLYLEEKVEREVPIAFRGSIELPKQFQLSNAPQFNPSTVKVIGAKSAVTALDSMAILPQEIKLQANEYVEKVRLSTPSNMELNTKEVELIIEAEQYTSLNIQQPIGIRNLPEGLNMRTFPSQIEVRLSLPLRLAQNIQEDDIELYVDFKEVSDEGKLKVRATLNQNQIKLLSLEKDKVEYLIYK